jgi:hypothetical protein
MSRAGRRRVVVAGRAPARFVPSLPERNKIVRWIPVLLLGLASFGCGDNKSPAAPTPPRPANVVGDWSGTFEYQQGSRTGLSQAVVVTLAQTNTTVSGNFAIVGLLATGSITGIVDSTSFTGTVQITMPSSGGGLCNGSGALTGPAPATSLVQTIRWTGPGFLTADCTNMPLGVVFALQRR